MSMDPQVNAQPKSYLLTEKLVKGLNQMNTAQGKVKKPLGKVSARLIGLVSIPFAALGDAAIHTAVASVKTLTGLVVSPGVFIGKVINPKYKPGPAVQNWQLSAAGARLACAVECVAAAALLPLICLISPSHVHQFITSRNQVQTELRTKGVDQNEKDLEDANKEIAQLKESVAKAATDKQTVEAQLGQKTTDYTNLNNRLTTLDGQKNQLEEDVKKLTKDLEQAKQDQSEEIKTQLNQKNQEFANLQIEKGDLENKAKKLVKEVEESKQNFEDVVVKSKEELKNANSAHTNNIEKIKIELDSTQLQLKEVTDTKKTLSQSFEKLKTEHNDLKNELLDLAEQQEQATKTVKDLEERLKEAQTQAQRMYAINGQLTKTLEEKQQEFEQQISTSTQNNQNLIAQHNQAVQDLNTEYDKKAQEHLNNTTELTAEIENLKAQLQARDQQLSALNTTTTTTTSASDSSVEHKEDVNKNDLLDSFFDMGLLIDGEQISEGKEIVDEGPLKDPLETTTNMTTTFVQDLAEGKVKKVRLKPKNDPDHVYYTPLTPTGKTEMEKELQTNQAILAKLQSKHPDETEFNLVLDFEEVNDKPIKDKNGKPLYTLRSAKAEGDLEALIADKNLTIVERIDIAHQVLKGLTYLQEAGYVHGDLKPENVLVFKDKLTGKRTVRIADFGKAREVDENTIKKMKGNPRFSPPEFSTSQKGEVFSAAIVIMRILEESYLPVTKKEDQVQGKERRGIEKELVDNVACPQFETWIAYQGGLKNVGMIWDRRGNAVASYPNAERAVHNHCNMIAKQLIEQTIVPGKSEGIAYSLAELLRDMTKTDPAQRISMSEAKQRLNLINNTALIKGATAPNAAFAKRAISQDPTIDRTGTKPGLISQEPLYDKKQELKQKQKEQGLFGGLFG